MLISNEQVFEKLFREYYSHLCNYAGRYIIDSQIIRDMYYKQQLPTYEEGFDRIYIIKSISDVLLPETMKKSL